MFLVYVQDLKTGKTTSFGAYDKAPLIFPQDKEFYVITDPYFNMQEFLKQRAS